MRCYNGAPDSKLKAIIDERKKALADAKAAGFHTTYFPAEGKWMTFDENHLSLSGFHDHPRPALEEALS